MIGRPEQSPCFLITIDTEGDDLWSRPRRATTRNAEYLERFQQLCEEFRLRPTWLTNNEMIRSKTFQRFAHEVLARDAGEFGMHLHAWDSPPAAPLTDDDARTHPYLIEYPQPIMREKIHALTATLEDVLGTKMTSHRAGRWGFDERYAELLVDEGYTVDCSVTPRVSWRSSPGDPRGNGGPDYTWFPDRAYWLDLNDISRPGESSLLEVPVTILAGRPPLVEKLAALCDGLPKPLSRSASFCRRKFPAELWLRPNGRNRGRLLQVLRRVEKHGGSYAQFMLHSSELMPGGSPTFRSEAAIEALYRDLRSLFGAAARRFRGATLAEFHRSFATSSSRARAPEHLIT